MIRRGLVANGDPRNIATFSNIPHFFLKAGLEERAPALGSRTSARATSHEAPHLERVSTPDSGCSARRNILGGMRARFGLVERLRERWRSTSATINCSRLETWSVSQSRTTSMRL